MTERNWPNAGKSCPVKNCSKIKFDKYFKLLKHWQEMHTEFVSCRNCPLMSCASKFTRRSALRNHLLKKHKINKDAINILLETADASIIDIPNTKYLNPGEALLPTGPDVFAREDERKRQARKRQHESESSSKIVLKYTGDRLSRYLF